MIRVMTAICLAAVLALVVIVVWGVGSFVATLLPVWAIFKWTMFSVGLGLVLLLGAALALNEWLR